MIIIRETINNLEKNGFNPIYYETSDKFIKDIKNRKLKYKTYAIGGSVTIEQLNIYQILKNKNAKVYWHWRGDSMKCGDNVDVYISSANAVSKQGHIYNIDGTGNRIKNLNFGHKKVYIIFGSNKITESDNSAKKRVQEYVAPKNAKRLKLSTPCVEDGKCHDCKNSDRICNYFSIIKKRGHNEIIPIIINEDLGY